MQEFCNKISGWGELCLPSYQWLSVIGAIRNNLNFSHAICFQACHASGKSQGKFFKVREFCKLSGIFKLLAKIHGIVAGPRSTIGRAPDSLSVWQHTIVFFGA